MMSTPGTHGNDTADHLPLTPSQYAAQSSQSSPDHPYSYPQHYTSVQGSIAGAKQHSNPLYAPETFTRLTRDPFTPASAATPLYQTYPYPFDHRSVNPLFHPTPFTTVISTEEEAVRRWASKARLRQRHHASVPHAALREMSIAHHNNTSFDDVPDFVSSRRSESINGNNTPDTPTTTGADEIDDRSAKRAALAMPDNDTPRPTAAAYPRLEQMEFSRGMVGLYRTESAACQDELFNPANFDPTPPSPPRSSKFPPPPSDHAGQTSSAANLVTEYVRTANQKRSQSPTQAAKTEGPKNNPFRKGASEAPRQKPADPNYSPPTGQPMPSAASIRQGQRDITVQKEFDNFRPPLQREVTKTISPKDALLDSPDLSRENSLSTFTDSLPEGYEKHLGGSQTFQNNFVSGTNQAFGQFIPAMTQAGTNMGGFRGLDLNNWLATPLNAMPAAALVPPTSTQGSDKNPVFPANLTSMESSASDQLPASSQDSFISGGMQRPLDTAANSGTYSCPSPGCIQRFDTPAKLQRHKRDAHTPISISSHQASTTPENGASATPSSGTAHSESPDADPDAIGSGMTSSALLARNSQAGPHKCTRLNPTTGKPCNSIFSRPYDLTRHEDTIHNNKKHKVRCEYCREEKTFSRIDALTRHMRVVHKEVDFQGKRGRKSF